jgi:ATP-dependent DNA ligase
MPSHAHPPPLSGELWLHESRVIAREDDKRVKLYTRPDNDLTYRFPLIIEDLARMRSRSCIIDEETVLCGDDGIAFFDRIRYPSGNRETLSSTSHRGTDRA